MVFANQQYLAELPFALMYDERSTRSRMEDVSYIKQFIMSLTAGSVCAIYNVMIVRAMIVRTKIMTVVKKLT